MAVIAIADMYGIEGRRDELSARLAEFEARASAESGCLRYTVAATVADDAQFLMLSEWESQDALDAHYRSTAFAEFQFGLDGLLARPSELTIFSTEGAVRPVDSRPMDPRDAD